MSLSGRYAKGEGYVLRGRLAVQLHAGTSASVVLLRNELPNGAFPAATTSMVGGGDLNLVRMTLRIPVTPDTGATGSTPSRKKLFG